MLSLDDEEDLIAERMIGTAQPEPRRRFSLRPVLMGLLVLMLGGALGGGAYLLSNMDTRDLIALLDIGDQPRLALELPGLSREPAPSNPGSGPLLTPPAPPSGAAPSLTPPPLAASPATPPAATGEAGGVAAMPMTPPLRPEPPPMIAPPVIAPPIPAGPVTTTPAPAAATAAPPAQPMPATGYQAPTYASLPARAGDPKPLPPAPLEALVRQSAYGLLPVVPRDAKQVPWKAYARPFDASAGKPRMAVVVTGLGLDKDATEAAIAKLPPEVTLAFSPYAGGLDKWVKKARDFGHEVMLMLPAEALGYPARDPGPWGLLVSNPPEENVARLEQVLARAPGAVGVLAPDGAFVRSGKLVPVLMALKERGMVFAGEGAKVDVDVASAAVSATLDVDLFRDAIEARLNTAARAAKESGNGLVVVSPRPVAFDRLLGWLDRLGDQGLVLAPATAVVKETGAGKQSGKS
ncbi:MAG: divergent polysaccharide deacetylase family protein [Bacteroidota bacterium]